MPYHWTNAPAEQTLTLWPHQSLTARGFVWFIGATAVMLAMPLLAVLGSPVVWVLLAFFIAAVWGVWHAIMRNRAARSMHEELRITPERLMLEHHQPGAAPLTFEANPYWVTVHLRPDGPVEKYLTLRGAGREVEIGRFLTPDERESLYGELSKALARR